MTDTIIAIQLITALVPSVALLAYLLLDRRQRIAAEHEHHRLEHEHDQLLRIQDAKRHEATLEAIKSLGPALMMMAQALVTKLTQPPMTVADLSDEEFAAELHRRVGGHYDDTCPDCAAESASEEQPIN